MFIVTNVSNSLIRKDRPAMTMNFLLQFFILALIGYDYWIYITNRRNTQISSLFKRKTTLKLKDSRVFHVLFAGQNNSKSRILLAGFGQYNSHFRISNTELRPSHYLSHGSLTPASSTLLLHLFIRKFFVILVGQTHVFLLYIQITNLFVHCSNLQD